MVFQAGVLAALVAAPSVAPSVALTFDDGTESEAVNASILKALADEQIHSVLFVAGDKIDSPRGLAQVRAWGNAGHLVGNHSYSHRNLSDPTNSLAQFQADVLRNEALLSGFPGFVRIFRFPFLKEGDTAPKRDGFRAFLRANGYRSGRVTIDASDWYYDTRFSRWKKSHPEADAAPFRDAYLRHIWDRSLYYDGLRKKVVGRSVKHTLLLHTNAINAAFLRDIVGMFKDRGWSTIDARVAFEDSIYDVNPKVLPARASFGRSPSRRVSRIFESQANRKNMNGRCSMPPDSDRIVAGPEFLPCGHTSQREGSAGTIRAGEAAGGSNRGGQGVASSD